MGNTCGNPKKDDYGAEPNAYTMYFQGACPPGNGPPPPMHPQDGCSQPPQQGGRNQAVVPLSPSAGQRSMPRSVTPPPASAHGGRHPGPMSPVKPLNSPGHNYMYKFYCESHVEPKGKFNILLKGYHYDYLTGMDIKEKIHEITGLQPHEQIIRTKGGGAIGDHQSLSSADLHSNGTITLDEIPSLLHNASHRRAADPYSNTEGTKAMQNTYNQYSNNYDTAHRGGSSTDNYDNSGYNHHHTCEHYRDTSNTNYPTGNYRESGSGGGGGGGGAYTMTRGGGGGTAATQDYSRDYGRDNYTTYGADNYHNNHTHDTHYTTSGGHNTSYPGTTSYNNHSYNQNQWGNGNSGYNANPQSHSGGAQHNQSNSHSTGNGYSHNNNYNNNYTNYDSNNNGAVPYSAQFGMVTNNNNWNGGTSGYSDNGALNNQYNMNSKNYNGAAYNKNYRK